MTREALVFAVSGAFFGLLVGWMLGSQQAGVSRAPAAGERSPQQSSASTASPAPAPLDEARVRTLRETAERDPKDSATRALLGNLYFDATKPFLSRKTDMAACGRAINICIQTCRTLTTIVAPFLPHTAAICRLALLHLRQIRVA